MGRFHILFLFFVSVMFAVSLVSLFGYHLYLVALNRTTLGKIETEYIHCLISIFCLLSEAFRAPIFRVGGPDKNGYHLGRYNNFQEVFGDNRKFWFLPIFSRYANSTILVFCFHLTLDLIFHLVLFDLCNLPLQHIIPSMTLSCLCISLPLQVEPILIINYQSSISSYWLALRSLVHVAQKRICSLVFSMYND